MGGVQKRGERTENNGVRITRRPHVSKRGRRYTRQSKLYRIAGDEWVRRT